MFDIKDGFNDMDIIDESVYREVIDQLKSEGNNDSDVNNILWDALEGSLEDGDRKFAKTISKLIRFHHKAEVDDLLSCDDSSDDVLETFFKSGVLRMDQFMGGFGKEIRMFVVPESESMPRAVSCPFTIDDLRNLMYLEEDQGFVFDPVSLITDMGYEIDVWAVRLDNREGRLITAIHPDGTPASMGPMVFMGRQFDSDIPVSLSLDEVNEIMSSIRIVTQTDVITGKKYNSYVIRGFDLQILDKAESVDVEDKWPYRVNLGSGNTHAIEVINGCMENANRTTSFHELSMDILQALILSHRSKADILDHLDEYEDIIAYYDKLVVDGFREAVRKLNVLNDDQVEEIRNILES